MFIEAISRGPTQHDLNGVKVSRAQRVKPKIGNHPSGSGLFIDQTIDANIKRLAICLLDYLNSFNNTVGSAVINQNMHYVLHTTNLVRLFLLVL